jgi:hypothetical protein
MRHIIYLYIYDDKSFNEKTKTLYSYSFFFCERVDKTNRPQTYLQDVKIFI